MDTVFESKMAEVVIDGKRLETLWLEPHDPLAPTIVMLHEGLGSIALWKDFPHKLASRTGCGVLVYSRYGHGNSDRLSEKRPVGFMHHDGEVVLPELIDRLRVPGTGILMLANCKHSPHRDQQAATLAKMMEFVAKITQTTDSARRDGCYGSAV